MLLQEVLGDIDEEKEVKEIKEPIKGKIVTRKKFAEISLEKTKEMMNRYRSRDGKGIEIKIGG